MHRASGSLVIAGASLAIALGSCSREGPSPVAPRSALASGPDACAAPPGLTLGASEVLPAAEPSFGARVLDVEVAGADALPRKLVRAALETRSGEVLDEALVAGDVRRLLALEALSDVRVETETKPGGAIVRFVLVPRHLVGRVGHRGLDPLPGGRWLPLAPGEIYDPTRLTRAARGLARELRDSGYLDARVEPRARLGSDERIDVCLRVQPGTRFTVERVDFPGASALSASALRNLLHTEQSKANVAGTPYREDLLERDLLWLSARYYDEGFVQVKVGPPRLERDRAHGRVRVLVPIDEGPRFVVGTVRFRGAEAKNQTMLRGVLGVHEGTTFDRSAIQSGIERLERRYRDAGKRVSVTPQSAVDAERRRVDLTLVLETTP
jgi:outer membrane protein insertion porin family